ncbi:MAG: ABC transporter permease [Nitrospira sp.]|nr:ABC transporter permease [Nitrospira sp.]
MTLWRLIVRNTKRRPLRSSLAVGGLAMVVLAFGLVCLTLSQWQAATSETTKNRLVTVHAMAESLRLPLAYKDRIAVLPGVQSVHYGVWVGGIYKDPKQTFGTFAEPAVTLLSTYPEIVLSEEHRLAFIRDRRSCIVGNKLAERYGWKLGDVIPLTGVAYSGQWEFIVRGIYESTNTKVFSDQEMYFHWEYLNEQLKTTEPDRADQVGWFVIRADLKNGASMVATVIDAAFSNSVAETRTQLEQAYIAGWIARSSVLLHGLEAVSACMNVIALLVLANVLTMSIRERTKEYGVLKTIGFRTRHFCVLILGESLLLALAGGLVGLGLLVPASYLYALMVGFDGYVPTYEITGETIWLCSGMMAAVGILASVWPIMRISRMSVLKGLHHIG